MTLSIRLLYKSLFRISFKQIVYDRHGVSEDVNDAWNRLEPFPRSLLNGYYTALEESRPEVLVPRLNAIEAEWRGVAFEGAGTGLMLLDCLLPWQHRLQAVLAGSESAYIPLIYIGAGLALARLHRRPERLLAQLDPVLCWFVLDGYGFHEGFFSWRRYVEEKTLPAQLSGYARRIFDQGLGRSIWFLDGADPDRISTTMATFQPARLADIWSGVSFACAYAGGANRAAIETLLTAAGVYRPQLARGAAVATQIRQQVGSPPPHTDLACEVLCGLPSHMAAHIADVALHNLPAASVEPAHAIWQQRIEAQFAAQAGETSHHLLNN